MKNKIITINGPTASGKTAFSIELAKHINGEIISCDSMQIYKYMDIGTAKPTAEEMNGVVHHLIDFVDPTDEFSCADYVELAKKETEDVIKNKKAPIFCGGTGLYVDNLIKGTAFSEAVSDENYRAALENEVKEKGIDSIYSQLQEVDPESALAIHKNNIKRVIRALEIYHLTGKPKSVWDKESKNVEPLYNAKMICLDFKDREKLYDRINKRVDIMIEQGLVNEVENLLDITNGKLSKTAAQAIGYKEIIEYINGKCSFDDAVYTIKKNTRNYAKRQLTWFRRYTDAERLYVDDNGGFENIVNIVEKFIF